MLKVQFYSRIRLVYDRWRHGQLRWYTRARLWCYTFGKHYLMDYLTHIMTCIVLVPYTHSLTVSSSLQAWALVVLGLFPQILNSWRWPFTVIWSDDLGIQGCQEMAQRDLRNFYKSIPLLRSSLSSWLSWSEECALSNKSFLSYKENY